MEFKKSLLALGVLTVLSGCGSSDDDKKETPNPDTSKPPVAEVITSDIKGVASKGTFINAPVYFYKYVDGAPVKLTAEELGAASTMTDEKGQYSAQVKVDGLVKVEIGVSQDINSPTYMICDAPAGCGQNAKGQAIAFGERINMTVKDPTFTLTSLISAAKNDGDVENTANITPLTHFAAALAEQRGDVSAESVSKAQSEIADTFGLIGALNELVPAKVEDQASLVDDDETDNLRYALINAGIAQALFAGSEGNVGDMSARLNSAITDLVAADGAFLVSRDNDDDAAFELTLEDILKGAEQATQQIIVLIKKDPALAKNLSRIADFELIVTKLNNEVAKKKKDAGEDGRSKGTETDTTEGDAVAKAAAMVNDIRVFANLFDVANTSGKEVQTQGEEFVQLVEDAGLMVEQQADSFKLLADVSEALAVIDSLRRAEKINTNTVDLKNYLALPGATGVATLDEDGLTFNIQAAAGDESLSAKVAITSNEANTEYSLSLSGTIENAAAKFTLNEGTKVSVTLNEAVTREQLTSDTFDLEAHGIEAVKGALNLELTLAQKKTDEVTNPVSFSGKLSAELVPVIVDVLNNHTFRDNGIRAFSSDYIVEEDTLVLPKLLMLSGDFKSDEGNKVAASFTVNVSNVESFEATGLTGFGRFVEDVATIKYSDTNTATVTNKDETESHTLTLLSDGADGTVIYQWAAQSSLESGYNGTGTIRSTIYNNDYYKLGTWKRDDGDAYTSVYRVVYEDYSFAMQDTGFSGSVVSFENGIITTDLGTEFDVNTADWYTGIRSFEQSALLTYMEVVDDPSKVTDLFSLISQPQLKELMSVKNEALGVTKIVFPDVKPAIGEEVAIGGTYAAQPEDREYKVVVNDKGTEVTATINGLAESHTVMYGDNNTFSYVYSLADGEKIKESQSVSFELLDIEGELKPYVLKSVKEYNGFAHSQKYIYFEPSKVNEEGDIHYQAYHLEPYAFNEQGKPVNSKGEVLDSKQDGYTSQYVGELNSVYNDSRYDVVSFGLNDENPALLSFKQKIWTDYDGMYYLDRQGFGLYAIGFNWLNWDDSEQRTYLDSIQPDTTIDVPSFLSQPDDTFELEDENNYLGVSAALNVDVVLGDYAVDLTLSGQRTEYQQGEFDLDIKYVIPGSDAQRSFTVEYDTKTETLSAKNAEGVSLQIIEPETVEGEEVDEEAEVEIGKIMVGEEVAATIFKRGSIVLVKYTDGAIESL